jgi:hypothetical protein
VILLHNRVIGLSSLNLSADGQPGSVERDTLRL